jgi:phosphoglycerate dehydrogenase-like enzyme
MPELSMRFVIVDPQFDGEPAAERQAVGSDVELFVQHYDPSRPVDPAVLASADALINYRGRHAVSRAVLQHTRSCRIVVQGGVGFNTVDIEAAAELGIPVCNVPNYGTSEVADHALALTLALARGVVAYNDRLRARDDAWHAIGLGSVRRLRGKTFAVVGLGRIGMAAARRAAAFDMKVAFYDPYLPSGTDLATGYRRAASLAELLRDADVVSVHTPLTRETEGLVDRRFVAALKPGAIYVNTSRGRTQDLDALYDGLKSGQLHGVGLDVLPDEPMQRTHPLLREWTDKAPWLEGRVIVTPHAAFFSPPGLDDLRRIACETAYLYLAKNELRDCVNLAWLKHRR